MAELDAKWNQLAAHILDFNYTVPQSQHATIAQKLKNFYLPNGQSFGEKRGQALIQVILILI